MRNTTRALTRHYIDAPDLYGDVLEIGGHTLSSWRSLPERAYRKLQRTLAGLGA
jgi:hypothetical protein